MPIGRACRTALCFTQGTGTEIGCEKSDVSPCEVCKVKCFSSGSCADIPPAFIRFGIGNEGDELGGNILDFKSARAAGGQKAEIVTLGGKFPCEGEARIFSE